MTIIVTYLVVFVVGPVLFLVLVRKASDTVYFTQLAALAVVLMIFSYVVPRGAGVAWQNWEYFSAVILCALWLAWITVLALCVLAVRRHLGSGQAASRCAVTLGATATTLPWFGLHLAQLVAK